MNCSMRCRYFTERTIEWTFQHKMIVFLGLLSFCLFVSVLALSSQKSRLQSELDALRNTPATTTETIPNTSEDSSATTSSAEGTTPSDVTTPEASTTESPSTTEEATTTSEETASSGNGGTETTSESPPIETGENSGNLVGGSSQLNRITNENNVLERKSEHNSLNNEAEGGKPNKVSMLLFNLLRKDKQPLNRITNAQDSIDGVKGDTEKDVSNFRNENPPVEHHHDEERQL